MTASLDPHDAGFAGSRGLDIVSGSGCWVTDSDGRRYLDATAMYGVASLGHAHPDLADALSEQSRRLVSCFASYGNDRRRELQSRLCTLLDPLDRVFLCNSGAESVEAAIKLARVVTGRPGVVALSRAFHGRTFAALSATARSPHREIAGPLVPGVRHVRPHDLDALAAQIAQGDVALVLVEIVQGEGGVHVLDPDYLRAVQQMCREAGVLFGVDEVQTGVGRTGAWFAHQRHGLEPDLVCLAKGLGGGMPIGALVFNGAIGTMPVGSHGSTFGGNPLACAAALATLDVIERDGLVQRAAAAGERLRHQLADGLGDRARDVRGEGLLVGVELHEASVPIQRRLQKRGVLTLGAGRRVLRMLPPLVITDDEIDHLTSAVIEVVQESHLAGAAS